MNWKQQLDQFFKDKLQRPSYKPDDTDWENMEQLLNKEQRKKRFRFRGLFWFLPVLIAILIALYIIPDNSKIPNRTQGENNPGHAPAYIESEESTTTENEIQMAAKTKNNSEAINEEPVSVSGQTTIKTEVIDTDNKISKTSGSQSEPNGSVKNSKPNIRQSSNRGKQASIAADKPTTNEPAILAGKVYENSDENKPDANKTTNENIAAKNNNVLNTGVNSFSSDSSNNKANADTIRETVPGETAKTPNDSTALNQPTLPQPADSVARKQNSKTDIKFSVGIEAAAGFINKSISVSGEADADYLNRRKSEESDIVKLQPGLQLALHFNNFIISTGVGLLNNGEEVKYSEKLKATYEDTVMVLTPDSSFILVPDSNFFDTVWVYFNDTSYMMDTVTAYVPDSTASLNNGKTQWTYFEVPLIFWYRYSINKINLDAGIGGSIGFLAKLNASYINKSNSGIENIKEMGYSRKTIYNFIAALRVGYNFNPHWMAAIDIRYKTNLNSVFENSYSVTQKYRMISTGLSLHYKF